MSQDAVVYEIRVKGHLSRRRVKMFTDLTVSHTPDGKTVLTGAFRDQAALFGLLNWLRDIGVVLLAVQQLEGGHE